MSTGAPYLETNTVVDALEVRDHLARVMKKAGVGQSVLSIDSARKIAEHLIREGLIDVRAVEHAMGDSALAQFMTEAD